MPRRRKPGSGTEYCAGFVDEHNQWNNGFYCPKWGGTGREYCCGPVSHKYCCPQEKIQPKQEGAESHQIPLMIGLAIGSFVLLMATLVLSCYFCRCCWGYKRRKRLQAITLPSGRNLQNTGRPNYAVTYSVCPHGTLLHEFMMPAPSYPAEDPPPYPGGPAIPLEEKQPLRGMEVEPGLETPGPLRLAAQSGYSHDAESEKSSTTDTSSLPPKISQNYSRMQGITWDEHSHLRDSRDQSDFITDTDSLDKRSFCSSSISLQADDSLPGTSSKYCASDTWPMSKSGIYHKMREMGECVGQLGFVDSQSSTDSYTG